MKYFQAHILKRALGLEEFEMLLKSYKAVNSRVRENNFVPTQETIFLLQEYLDGKMTYKEVKDEINQGSSNIYYTLLQAAKWLNQEGLLTIQKPRRMRRG